MLHRAKYDVDAQWDDPFERQEDRRDSLRYASNFRITVFVEGAVPGRRLKGPGLVKDVSLSGVRFLTKHQLAAGQEVSLALPTDICPDSMGLPSAFLGPARVIRVLNVDDRRRVAGLKFGDALSMNMDFAVFMEYLCSISSVMYAS